MSMYIYIPEKRVKGGEIEEVNREKKDNENLFLL